jgi:hypothetical protein
VIVSRVVSSQPFARVCTYKRASAPGETTANPPQKVTSEGVIIMKYDQTPRATLAFPRAHRSAEPR